MCGFGGGVGYLRGKVIVIVAQLPSRFAPNKCESDFHFAPTFSDRSGGTKLPAQVNVHTYSKVVIKSPVISHAKVFTLGSIASFATICLYNKVSTSRVTSRV